MKIKKQDTLTLASAFLIGIIAGSYLYTVGYAPEFESDNIVRDEQNVSGDSYLVVGEMYGGMRAGVAPSFEVDSDGDYMYTPFSESEDVVEENTVSGTLPAHLRTALQTELEASTLEAASEPIVREMCAQMVDGIDYAYTITLEGEDYALDTCHTDFSRESDLGTTFGALWQYFDTLATPDTL